MFYKVLVNNLRLIFCFCFLFFESLLFAQNLSVDNLVKPAFKEYFGLPRASIFLHLNKSDFVIGEHLWFKGYLYNRLKSEPFIEPLNLYVGIYDESGNLLKKELFISKEGVSQGQIKIDSSFNAGLYYVKATTSWMRNFKEDDSYVQQFRVVRATFSKETNENNNKLDIQLLPEGGHLIYGVQGTVGVKVLNPAGFGVQGLKGYLTKISGDTVARFETNEFGLAKFGFTPEKEEKYRSTLIDGEGNKFKFLLPKIADKGIGMSVKRIANDRILILLGTNALTRNEIANKPYSLLFHRDGLLKHINVNFPINESYVSYVLDSEELHKGMNIITLIDNKGKPIAERLVFNSKKINYGKLDATFKIIQEDSVKISLFDKSERNDLDYLSASILPVGTQAYRHEQNILSSFLLNPYINGFIEQPSYYFSQVDQYKEEQLDLLLLTQGWSKYSWDNIFNVPPIKKYDFRTGVNLYGKLNFDLAKNQKLLLYPGNMMEPQIIELKRGSKEFSLKNYYLENGDKLQLTVTDANGNLSRPNLYLRLDAGITIDRVYKTQKDNFENKFKKAYEVDNFIVPNRTILLDEVVILEKKKEEKDFTSPLIADHRLTVVTKQIEQNFPKLLDLIRYNGYDVFEIPNAGYDRIRITTKRPTSFRGKPSPVIYINDIYQPDFNMLQDFSTREVESFLIDRTGNGEPGAGGGVIRVYTRKGSYGAEDSLNSSNKSDFFKHVVKRGFSPIKEFYVPNYSSVTEDSFINFGTIHWEPKIRLDKSGKASFSFSKVGTDNFNIYIEGMGMNGTLFSTMKTIKIDLNN